MTVWLIDIDRREGESAIRGPFASFSRALKTLEAYVDTHYTPECIASCLKAYGGNLATGRFCSEDETIQVVEREVIE